jgi:hypothetical protein
MYLYFYRSNKHHTELHKLADLMKTKGNKLLRNIETRWISMRSLAKRIMSEYMSLMVKMGFDMTAIPGNLGRSQMLGLGTISICLWTSKCRCPWLALFPCWMLYIILSSYPKLVIYSYVISCKLLRCARKNWPGSSLMETRHFPNQTSNDMVI